MDLFDVAGMDKDVTRTLSMSFYEGEQFLRCRRTKNSQLTLNGGCHCFDEEECLKSNATMSLLS